jgi:hypothetical protein
VASALSQPWDAGSEADQLVSLYVSDANDTLMALVELGKVPTDGTWEVLHGGGVGWAPFTVHHHLATALWGDESPVLVVARPIGSGNE